MRFLKIAFLPSLSVIFSPLNKENENENSFFNSFAARSRRGTGGKFHFTLLFWSLSRFLPASLILSVLTALLSALPPGKQPLCGRADILLW